MATGRNNARNQEIKEDKMSFRIHGMLIAPQGWRQHAIDILTRINVDPEIIRKQSTHDQALRVVFGDNTRDTSFEYRGHIKAFVTQPHFSEKSEVQLFSVINPWRPYSFGFRFHSHVLMQAHYPATIEEIIDIGIAAGFSPEDTHGHLRWLYTWGGAYLIVDGENFRKKGSHSTVFLKPSSNKRLS